MVVPVFLGLPAHAWGGLLLFLLIAFQVMTGARIVKPDFQWHRKNGYLIMVIALLHAATAIGVTLGVFRVG
ncbi:MAG: hypothetical protein ACM3QZ_05255 [Solirubrobacterales bacterium]